MKLSEISEIIKFDRVKFTDNYPPRIFKTAQKFKNLEVISMIYKSDKLKIHGFIFKKKGIKKKKPVVIYCRGGNNHKKMNHEMNLKPWKFFYIKGLLKLVSEGKIIVFASNYRGSRLSEGKDEFCGKDINDTINLYPIIKKYKLADSKNIGIYGWSRGCTTALMVLKKTKWIKCIVLGAGKYNYIDYKKFRPSMYKMLTKDFKLSTTDLKNRSAINWVNKLPSIPMLLLHGTSDWRVSVENSLKLSLELFKFKKPYKLIIYPGGDHGLTEYYQEVSEEVIMHLEKFLLNNEKINLDFHGK
jgi:dipeptidyl aminopeptidase/acylaminoacyl peptidase